MANARHHRHGASCHRTGKVLVVEGHEVLEGNRRRARAKCNRSAGVMAAARCRALNKLRRRALALDLGTHANELDKWVATAQRTLDVVDHGARKRGDDRHA